MPDPAPRSALCAATFALCVGLAVASSVARADAPPRLLSAPEVAAPPSVQLAPGASVSLQLRVDETGSVTDVRVLQSIGPEVDASVLEAARRMRFAPAERDGVPVAVSVRFRFRLRPASSPAGGEASGSASAPGAPGSSAAPAGSPGAGSADGPGGAPSASTTGPGSSASGSGAAPGATTPAGSTTPPGATRGRAPGAASDGSGGVPPNPFASAPPSRDPPESGVTVRGRHEPGAATRESFRAEELTTVPGTFGEPTRIVATQPGVARTPFGLGYFLVRGASFENTGFFIDGFPVLIMYHLAAGPAVISSRLVGQLDFYPGGYPAQFGRFTAGVISLETRAPPADRPRVEAELDFFRASALGVLPFDNGRGSVAIAVRRSYYDVLLPLISPGVVVNYGDAQLRADYRLSDRVRASLFVFGSMDLFDRTETTGQGATTSTSRDGLEYNFARAIARIEYRDPRGYTAQLSGMIGYDDTRIIQSDPGRADRGLRGSGTVLGQRASVRLPLTRQLTTTLGVDTLAYVYGVDLAFPSPSGLLGVPMPQSNPRVANIHSGVTQLSIAPYIEEVFRAGPLEVTAGLRIDHQRYAGNAFTVLDPRGVARLRVHDRVTVIASSGLFHQPPLFFSLIPQAGNPDLVPEQAWQSSLGAELTLPYDFEARVTGFFTRMWQLVRPTYDIVDTPSGPRRALAASDGEGRSYGLEVLLRRRLERGIYGWLSYTLSRSERFIGAGRVVPFTYDQTHVLNVAASWDVNADWRVGARFGLATGSPTSQVSGGIYDSDADGFRPQYTSEADRLPLYHQLDIRVDYRFRLGALHMSAYLDVLNVYWAQNAENWIYQYDYARREPRAGIPILPTLGIRGEL